MSSSENRYDAEVTLAIKLNLEWPLGLLIYDRIDMQRTRFKLETNPALRESRRNSKFPAHNKTCSGHRYISISTILRPESWRILKNLQSNHTQHE